MKVIGKSLSRLYQNRLGRAMGHASDFCSCSVLMVSALQTGNILCLKRAIPGAKSRYNHQYAA